MTFNLIDKALIYRSPLRLLETLKSAAELSHDLAWHHAIRGHKYDDSGAQDKDAYKRGFEAGKLRQRTPQPAATSSSKIGLSDSEKSSLGQLHPSSKKGYKYIHNWKTFRDYLVSRSKKSNPNLDTELTAYTPGETLDLLNHHKIKSWHDEMRNFTIPDVDAKGNKYTHTIFVPCAKTKPWDGSCNLNRSIYSSYNQLRDEIRKTTGQLPNSYFVTISEPLGVVPQDRWGDFPQYDNPGLFRNAAQRSGLFHRDWKNLPQEHGGTGQPQYTPFDNVSYNKSIDLLSGVIADFVHNNKKQNPDMKFVSFVEDKPYRQWDDPNTPRVDISTHSDMLTRAGRKLEFLKPEHRFLKRGQSRQSPYDYMRQKLLELYKYQEASDNPINKVFVKNQPHNALTTKAQLTQQLRAAGEATISEKIPIPRLEWNAMIFNLTDETSLYRYPLRLLEALKGEEKKSWDLGYHHATRNHDYSDSDTQDKDAYKRGFEAGNPSRTTPLQPSQFQRLRSQKSGSVDGLDSITQQGKLFKTGVPVKFTFVRNTESSPNFGATYGQDIEPAGRYMLHNEDPGDTPGWVSGSIKFNSPLVLKLTMGGSAYGPQGWKARLSKYYGGEKGKALSKAIRRDGYDGIVTIDDGKFRGTAEIVDLTQHRNAELVHSETAPAGPYSNYYDKESLVKHTSSPYYKGDDRSRAIASSREVMANNPDIDPGSWRISNLKLLHGRDIEQLGIFNPKDLRPDEFDWENPEAKLNDEGRLKDARRYAKWINDGHEAPPISAIQNDRGDIRVTDGHRRLYAAHLAGKPVRAWVSWTTDHPNGHTDWKGNTIKVGLTHEVVSNSGLPDNVRHNGDYRPSKRPITT
jgi:hypothetical protein